MRASVYIATSLDGFIAREDGGLDWLPGTSEHADSNHEFSEPGLSGAEPSNPAPNDSAPAEEQGGGEDYGYHAFMDSVDVLVMGRNTFELVLSFDGEWPYGDKRMVVLSQSLTQLPDHAPATVELFAGTPTEIVQMLEQTGATHAYVDGGKTIQGFLRAGLIQEMIITRIPVLIGSGIPLFGPLDQDIHLKHIETQAFVNGFVQSKYAVRL